MQYCICSSICLLFCVLYAYYLFTYIDTLTRGRQEYNRLVTIRTTSLTNIISVIRHDIYTLWVEMGVTSIEDQKREFESYFVGSEQLTDSAVSIDVYMCKISLCTCICMFAVYLCICIVCIYHVYIFTVHSHFTYTSYTVYTIL